MDCKVESDLLYTGFLLACLANEQSVQIGGIDRSREAAAVCIGHSKGIRRVAELF